MTRPIASRLICALWLSAAPVAQVAAQEVAVPPPPVGGTGTVILSGSGTYTGSTTVNGGTLTPNEVVVPPPEKPSTPPAPARTPAEIRRQADALIKELPKAAPARREAIETELVALGTPAQIALTLAAGADDLDLRQAAASVVVRVRWRTACGDAFFAGHAGLLAAMQGDGPARLKAVAELGASKDEDALAPCVPFFTECLADPSVAVRQSAVDGLIAAGGSGSRGEPAKSALRSVALDNGDPAAQVLAIAGLGKIRAMDGATLARLMETDGGEVRAAALQAAGYSQVADCVPQMAQAARDPDWRVRAAAMQALELLCREHSGNGASGPAREKAGAAGMHGTRDAEVFVRVLAAKVAVEAAAAGAGDRVLEMWKAGQLDEADALPLLAQARHPEALRRITAVLGGKDAGKAQQALQWIRPYVGKDAAADALLDGLLKDESKRALWPETIETLASGLDYDNDRNGRKRFALFSPLLFSDDRAAAQAAFKQIAGQLSENPLSAEQLKKLKESPEGWRRQLILVLEDHMWRRPAHNLPRQPEGEMNSPALLALESADAQVVAAALAMIAADRMNDDLGASEEESLSYLRYDRFDLRSVSQMYVNGRDQPAPPDPAFPAPLLAALRKHLATSDAVVGTRAAAILYYTKADRSEAVTNVLKKALSSRGPELVPALAALVQEPGTLADALDFPALWNGPAVDGQAKARALRVAAASGRAAWQPLVLEAAKGVELGYDEDGRMVLAAVLRMGEPGMALVVEKWLAVKEPYEAQNFVTAETFKALPAAVKLDFAARVLAVMEKSAKPKPVKTAKQPNIFNQEGERADSLLDMLLATDDAKALPLILSAQKLAGQRGEWKKEQIQQFVFAHDPEAQKQFWAEFAKEPAQKLADYQTINRITQFAATPENTDRVRAALRGMAKAAKPAGAGEREDFSQLWVWFPPAVRAQITAELNHYPVSIRRLALMAAMSAPDASLDKWLAIPATAADWDAGVPRAAWWLANGAEVSLEGRTPAQLALLLPAEALRPDAPEKLAPFAADKDSSVVAAAARGLALCALFTGKDPGPAAHAAWGHTFKRKSIRYAALCAEAFLKVNPAAFTAFPDKSLGRTAGPTVRAFRFCAKVAAGQKVAPEDADRMALRACANGPYLAVFWPAMLADGETDALKSLGPWQLAACPDRTRLAQLGLASGDPGLLANLLSAKVLTRRTPGFAAAADSALAKSGGTLPDPQRMVLFKAGCKVAEKPEALSALLQTAVLTNDTEAQVALVECARAMGAPAQAAWRTVRDENGKYALPLAMGSAAALTAAFPGDAKDKAALAAMLAKVDVSGQQYDQQQPAFLGGLALALHAADKNEREAFAKRLEGMTLKDNYQSARRIAQLLPLLMQEDPVLGLRVLSALAKKNPQIYEDYESRELGVLALRNLPADISGFGNLNSFSSGGERLPWEGMFNEMKRAQAGGFAPPSEELRRAFGSVAGAGAGAAPDAPSGVVEDDGADVDGEGIQLQVQTAVAEDKRPLPELETAIAAAKTPEERARLGALAVLKRGQPNAELKLAQGVLLIRGKLPTGGDDEGMDMQEARWRAYRNRRNLGDQPPTGSDPWQAMLHAVAKTESPAPAAWAPDVQMEDPFAYGGRGNRPPAHRLPLPGLLASPLAPIQLTPPGTEFLALPGLPQAPSSPLDSLVGLEAQEQFATQAAFVSFASQAKNPADLRLKWQAWWKAHAGESRDAWWRLAVAQSVADLSHRDWWWRVRAAVRLENLTGRRVDMPALFKVEDWAKLRLKWEAWQKTPEAAMPLAALLAQAKLPAPPPDPTPEKRLELLAGLAESKDPLLAAAARWQLAALPAAGKKALVERWGKSDNGPLNQWANTP